MLEIKNLTKIYRTKGEEVKALDSINLTLEETGMVFLLGKSGSGKSTLLNVTGGLDSPTDGEIVLRGRSSRNFTQSDFDSYRNTYVGFIFQEYNILNDFTVEDNIALALELQGKSKDERAIAQLLDEVDLSGLQKRKPNTLSGGQKQRVAIARALIKNPQIIMADEPSGALDSETGKQVFETLKKLSKTRLVLVVSHDRDFAETYGDRIIELMDGKIISDITKTRIGEGNNSNVSVIGDNLLIKSGKELTDSDFETIKQFVKDSQLDVVIAKNPDDVVTFKKNAKISDDNVQETFVPTDQSAIVANPFTQEEFHFIKSTLPPKHAIKMGASGLKVKPVRLFFTILLCTIAFCMLGLTSTLTYYDNQSVFRQSLIETNAKNVKLEKRYYAEIEEYANGELIAEYYTTRVGYFSQEDVEKFKESLSSNIFGCYRSSIYFYWNGDSLYFEPRVNFIAPYDKGNSLLTLEHGNEPKTDTEVCISSFLAQCLIESQTCEPESKQPYTATSIDQLIGCPIEFFDSTLTICGIFSSQPIPKAYESLKTDDDYMLYMEMNNYLGDSIDSIVFVTENCYKTAIEADNFYFDNYYNDQIKVNTKYVEPTGIKHSYLFVPVSNNTQIDAISEIYGNSEYIDDVLLTVVSSVASSLEYINMLVEIFSTVFLWMGIVTAVFASLLLFNFICVSISYKKHEIGILRAVGARSVDVFKIFFAESAIIASICVVLSCILSALITNSINQLIIAELNISVLVFSFLSVLTIISIAILTAIVSTFIPVYSASKKKPIDSIRAI